MINFNFLKRKKAKKTSKYIRKYGMTLSQIAAQFNTTPSTIYNWISCPEKKEWLERQLGVK